MIFILDLQDKYIIFVLYIRTNNANHFLDYKEQVMKTITQQRLADAVTMDLPELIERECRLPKIPNKA
ncbi:MAG: hypothetical protein HWN68_12135 [Desulfobacterales bacterium]|nr:hypothetical protein [Desulfobacterales bacterium]